MRGTKSPIKSFLENPDDLKRFDSVRRWLSTVRQDGIGSDKTEAAYLLFLNKYCGFWNKNPDQLIEERKHDLDSSDEAEQRKVEEQLREFCNYLEQKLKLKGGSMKTYHGAVRSFYAANYVELKMKTPVRAAEQRMPAKKEEIVKMLNYTNPRDRAIVLGLKDSGISAEDFVKLTYGNIQHEYEKGVVPICIQLIREKEQVRYQTLLGVEAVEALREYLDERKRRGEEITSSSPLFIGDYKNGKQLTTRGLSSILRRLCKRAGVVLTSHGLRKYFETSIALGLPRGSPAYLPKYWTGHSLGVEGHYFIPPIEEQREAYRQAYEKLALTPQKKVFGMDEWQVKREAATRALRVIGLDPEEMLKVQPRITTVEEEVKFFDARLKEAMLAKQLKPELGPEELGPTYESTVIKEKDLPAYLKKGWEFVNTLNREKVVIKRKLGKPKRKASMRVPDELIPLPIKKRRTEHNGGNNNHNGNHDAFKIVEEDGLIPLLEQDWEIVKELSNGKIVVKRAG